MPQTKEQTPKNVEPNFPDSELAMLRVNAELVGDKSTLIGVGKKIQALLEELPISLTSGVISSDASIQVVPTTYFDLGVHEHAKDLVVRMFGGIPDPVCHTHNGL